MPIIRASEAVTYTIPEDWWAFCGLNEWKPSLDNYGYREPVMQAGQSFIFIPLGEIEPIDRRLDNGLPFRKYKLIPVLFAFQSPERVLPPIEVERIAGRYHYRLVNGFHRYVASLAVGYSDIPALIWD